jgi:hypothetical protein
MQSPADRRLQLVALHAEVTRRYLIALKGITAERAAQSSADGRTIAQVVGHIAEWERFFLIAAGEVLPAVKRPRLMRLSGYRTPDGGAKDLESLDAFGTYQAGRQASLPWYELTGAADAHGICMSRTLRRAGPADRRVSGSDSSVRLAVANRGHEAHACRLVPLDGHPRARGC